MRLILVEREAQLFMLPKEKCACGMVIEYSGASAVDGYAYKRTDRSIIGKPVFEFVTKET